MNSAPKFNSRDRRIMAVTCYGHFLSHFNMLVFPAVLLPLSRNMNLDMAHVIGFSVWMYFLFGVTALPWGMVADRWSPVPLMKIFFVGAGLSGLAAAHWINSPAGLTLSLTAIGIFSGIYHPAGLGWISKEVERVSYGMGVNGMFGSLGLAAAPFLAGIVNWLYGPWAVYIVLGFLNLSGAVLMYFLPKFKPMSQRESEAKEGDSTLEAFLILLVAMMLAGIAYRGATVILPAYFELKNKEVFDWVSVYAGGSISENLVATIFVSFIYLVGMGGQYAGGLVAERFDLRRSYLVFHLITLPPVFVMYLATDLPLILLAMIYIFFLVGMQPIENTLIALITPKKLHSSAFGAKFILTFGVGAVAVKMIKEIKLNYSIEAVFPFLGLVSTILVMVIILLIFRTKPYN